MIEMTEVESSNVKALGYDESRHLMYVEFIKSGYYAYAHVPKEVFDNWLTAESKGKYFHAHIKEKFEYMKLEGGLPS